MDRIGSGLTVTGRAGDGTVEAVEVTDHPFAIGVQWESGHTADRRLHRALAHAARERLRKEQADAVPIP
ncbi:hypothetical protein GCM10020256_00640 [Streptomyces thermocoprophilus]